MACVKLRLVRRGSHRQRPRLGQREPWRQHGSAHRRQAAGLSGSGQGAELAASCFCNLFISRAINRAISRAISLAISHALSLSGRGRNEAAGGLNMAPTEPKVRSCLDRALHLHELLANPPRLREGLLHSLLLFIICQGDGRSQQCPVDPSRSQ